MSNREIANKVMDGGPANWWHPYESTYERCGSSPTDVTYETVTEHSYVGPSFLTDASADYAVLDHVRHTWEPSDFVLFEESVKRFVSAELGETLLDEFEGFLRGYVAGLFSRAALAVVTAKESSHA